MNEKVAFFRALGDETRLKIVLALLDREKPASEIVNLAGKAQPTVSLALKELVNAKILESRKEGRSVYYSLSNKTVPKIIALLEKNEPR